MTPVALMCLIIAAITGTSQGTKKLICAKDKVTLQCQAGHVLVFQKANYGRTDSTACQPEVVERPCLLHSTIAILGEKCFGRQSCDLTGLPQMFSDPCPQHTKYLDVEYECVKNSEIYSVCDKVPITTSRGYITSPGYPWAYPHNSRCTRLVQSPAGKASNVTLLDIELEARDTRGCFDWLILKEKVYSWLRNDYCGNILTITSPPNKLFHNLEVQFKTDAVNQYRGFVLKFETVDAPDLVINMELIKTVPKDRIQTAAPRAPKAAFAPTPADGPKGDVNNIILPKAGAPKGTAPPAQQERAGKWKSGIHNVDPQERLLVVPELVNGKLVIPKQKAAVKRKSRATAKTPAPKSKKRCFADDLPLPEFAEVREVHNDLTTYIECMPGYRMEGEAQESVVTCIKGVWVGDPGACTLVGCPVPESPVHGKVKYPDTREGSEATYRCDKGFLLVGKQVRTCLPLGKWSGNTPTCKDRSNRSYTRRHGGIWFELPLAVAITMSIILIRNILNSNKICRRTTGGNTHSKMHTV